MRLIVMTTLISLAACQTAPATQQTDNEWSKAGVDALNARINATSYPDKAKNVILFVGDGMGISTVTAARIFDGQSRGQSGEENFLAFENFPNVALSKT